MLLEFKLRNYRSFLGAEVFRYPPIVVRGRPASDGADTDFHPKARIPRVAVVFGPNGTGKTNLILALATLRDLVLHSTTYSDAQFAEQYTPFHFLRPENRATDLEIQVQLEDGRYHYSLSYDSRRILFERLLVYRTGKPQRWFQREYDRDAEVEKWAPFSPNFVGSRDLWRRTTRSKALFLTTAARLECEQLRPLLEWFERDMQIWYGTDSPDFSNLRAAVLNLTFKERLLAILRAVDLPIVDMRIMEGAGRANDRPKMGFLYAPEAGRSQWIDSESEAHGTLRLLNLLGPLLSSLENGRLLVMDEFDASLHPLVSRFLIHLAKRSPAARGRPQFLLTSHHAGLMVPEVLEHEEIWLVERDGSGSSHLQSVAQRSPRKRERLVKGYLQGRYGAVPHIEADWLF